MEKTDEFPEDRLFTLKEYANQFQTGVCTDGRQVVLGPLLPDVVAYFFDAHGNVLGSESRPDDIPSRHIGSETQCEWQAELGFIPGAIHIRGFFNEEEYVGIQLIPDYLHLDEIALESDEEERRLLEGLRAEWLSEGQFIWCWGDEHWMSADGDIVST